MTSGYIFYVKKLYTQYLEKIEGVRFTQREIDIISLLMRGRGVKKIASFLSVSPRTVETHIKNMMLKLECNSREHIIDFVENSSQLTKVVKYYNALLINDVFETTLLRISSFLNLETVYYYISPHLKKAPPIAMLEEHLQILGLKFQDWEDNGTPSSKPINRLLQIKSFDDYRLIHAEKDQDHSSNNDILVKLEDSVESRDNQYNNKLQYIDFSCPQKYYLSFFESLQKIFTQTDFFSLIEEFKKTLETSKISDKIKKEKVQNPKNSEKISVKAFLHILTNLRFSKKLGVFIFSCLILCGCVLFYAPASDENFSSICSQEHFLPHKSFLIERRSLISLLKKKFEGKQLIKKVILVGIGGSGKTVAVRQYVNNLNPPIFWEINARTKESTITSFEKLAVSLAFTEQDKKSLSFIETISDPQHRIEATVTFIKHQLKLHPNWVIIYDNVEDPSFIREFIPHNPAAWGKGKVILITRNDNIANSVLSSSADIIYSPSLSDTEKEELFFKIMSNRKKIHSLDIPSYREFLEKLPPFPLDINTAAHYLRGAQIDCDEYIRRIENDSVNFSKRQKSFLKSMGENSETRFGIISTSLEKIAENPAHKELLIFMSLLNSYDIPLDWLTAYKGAYIVEQFLEKLKEFSFLNYSEKFKKLENNKTIALHQSTHSILQVYIKQLCNKKELRDKSEKIATILNKFMKIGIKRKNINLSSLLTSHVPTFLRMADLSLLTKAYISKAIGKLFLYLNEYKPSIHYFDTALSMYEKIKSPCKKNIIGILKGLGRSHCRMGKGLGSLKYLKDALNLGYREYGKSHPYIGTILAEIGFVYYEIGNYLNAKTYLEKALKLLNKNVEKSQEQIANTKIILGVALRHLGYPLKSLKLYEEALSTKRKIYGEFHVEIFHVKKRIATIYLALGKHFDAQKLFEESLAAMTNAYGSNHLAVAWIMNDLGNINLALGNYKKARDLLEKVKTIWVSNYGQDHFKVSWILNNIANIHFELGNIERASQLYKKSLKIKKPYYGSKHPIVADAIEKIGIIHLINGEYETAKTLFEKAFKIKKLSFKEGAVQLTSILENIGTTHFYLGNNKLSRKIYEDVLKYKEKFYGKKSIATASIRVKIAQLLIKLGESSKAYFMLKQSLKIYQTEHHPKIYRVFQILGDLYIERYKKTKDIVLFKNACLQFKKASAILRQTYHINHPDFLYGKERIRYLKKIRKH